MKTYDVTIKAIVIKTYTVEAEDEDEASLIAHEDFTVESDDTPERYEQETVEILEVSQ